MHTPYIIERNEGYERTYDIYSKLLIDRIIFLEGEITDLTANTIVSELLYLDSINNDDIYLYINSPGGVVTAGMSIYDTMQFIRPDVCTLCMGQAASMGSFLLSGGAKGKRFALPSSRIMIHQPLGGFRGQASDIAIHANEILRLKQELNEKLAQHTGRTVEEIEAATDRDNFLSAQEALEFGLIDKVITKRDEAK